VGTISLSVGYWWDDPTKAIIEPVKVAEVVGEGA